MQNGLTLYDIEKGLVEALESRQLAETPQELEAAELALATYAEQELKKADGYIATFRSLKAAIANRKAEAQRQIDAARTLQASLDWLSHYAIATLEHWGVKAIEGKTGKISLRGNGGQHPLTVDENLLPAEYLKTETIVKPDTARIRADIEAGIPVPGCRLEERGVSLSVK